MFIVYRAIPVKIMELGSGGVGGWTLLAAGFGRVLARGPVIGDRVQRAGLAHALALVIDNDPAGGVFALKADLNGAVGQVARSLEANAFEREGIVGASLPVFLDEEQFVVGLVGREETDVVAIQGKAVQGAHAQNRMKLSVVVFLDPLGELSVQRFQGG